MSQVRARTIRRKPFDAEASTETPLQEGKKLDFPRTQTLITPVERVSGSNVVMKNYFLKELQKKFDSRVKHWTVEEFYPYAVGGPMIFERPLKGSEDWAMCLEKQKFLRTLGYRYAIVRECANVDEQIQDLAEQIEGKA